MRKLFLFGLLAVFLISCKKENKEELKPNTKKAQAQDVVKEDIPTYDYKGLKPFLNKEDDKTYVVNFWATWCAPCVKELPYFEKINKEYKDQNVEVLLVSLDFPKQKKSRLLPFVQNKNIESKVIHLDDLDEQFWIADINDAWSGALPATLIYNKNERKFFEKSFTQEELINELQLFLN